MLPFKPFNFTCLSFCPDERLSNNFVVHHFKNVVNEWKSCIASQIPEANEVPQGNGDCNFDNLNINPPYKYKIQLNKVVINNACV